MSLFNKCPHCLLIIPLGKIKCPQRECIEIRKREAKSKRVQRIKNRTDEYYSKRLRPDIKCRSCGKAYNCYHLNAVNLPLNAFFGECTECKNKRKVA